MDIKMKKIIALVLASLLVIMGLIGCSSKAKEEKEPTESKVETVAETEDASEEETGEETDEASEETKEETVVEEVKTDLMTITANVSSTGVIDATDLFTERDLTQEADLSNAETIAVKDGEDISITKEGVYVLSGNASNVTVKVEVQDTEKVQIVLDGVSITNDDFPAIYVVNGDKVFVTTTDSENNLSVTGTFVADGETNTDAVIFSRDDVIINGLGSLNITSSENGITSKDDLKITGGTLTIECESDALEANESILVADGIINVSTNKDGLHAENADDNTTGYIYICGGTFNIDAYDDAIHGTTVVQIDGGEFDLAATEAIEGTYLQFNGGNLNIYSYDDAINASYKSYEYTPTVEVNDGRITISMAQGDTDAVDSNSDLYINGGTLDITAQSPFDYDGYAEYNGGTIIVNGVETNAITNQMMGGHGGFGGGPWG